MPHYGTGVFFGYREQAPPDERTPRLRPQGSINPMKLTFPEIQMLAVSAYDYRTFNGQVPEDYETWNMLPWRCRIAKFMLDGGPIEVQITYDGTEIGDTRTLRASLTTLDSFVGFRVRQLIPGFGAWYQCIPII